MCKCVAGTSLTVSIIEEKVANPTCFTCGCTAIPTFYIVSHTSSSYDQLFLNGSKDECNELYLTYDTFTFFTLRAHEEKIYFPC